MSVSERLAKVQQEHENQLSTSQQVKILFYVPALKRNYIYVLHALNKNFKNLIINVLLMVPKFSIFRYAFTFIFILYMYIYIHIIYLLNRNGHIT